MGVQTAGAELEAGADPQAAFCAAVAEDLYLLASLHDREPDAAHLGVLREVGIKEGLGLRLVSERACQALDVFTAALQALPAVQDRHALDDLAADYASIYLTHAIQASPEESVWIDEEHLACQDCMFQVRAWYAQYGLGAPDWRKRPDDHLVLELQFIAHLVGQGGSREPLQQAALFMDEHLLRWLTAFAERVASRCATAYFAGAAMLTAAYAEELRDLLVDVLGEPRPSAAEIEERMRPKRNEIEEMPVKFMPGMGPAV